MTLTLCLNGPKVLQCWSFLHLEDDILELFKQESTICGRLPQFHRQELLRKSCWNPQTFVQISDTEINFRVRDNALWELSPVMTHLGWKCGWKLMGFTAGILTLHLQCPLLQFSCIQILWSITIPSPYRTVWFLLLIFTSFDIYTSIRIRFTTFVLFAKIYISGVSIGHFIVVDVLGWQGPLTIFSLSITMENLFKP